ncbi:OmpA family protein [Candidatus Jorgensenbacteria bacterium]|nr:OmpA family protein [Candidatus Jorgensenbacteria bacterium]
MVFSFRDAMNMVGMTDAGDDFENSTFASVYRSFGNLTIRKYPEKQLKAYLPFGEFFDGRALRMAYNRAKGEGVGTAEVVEKRDYAEATGEVIGSTSYSITFKTGSAEVQSSAYSTLQEIQDNYAATEYGITIVGHTDRTGTDAVNQPLSYERAESVKRYLIARNSRDFGGDRINTEGKGSSEPAKGVDPNYAGENAKCRRVEIIIHR